MPQLNENIGFGFVDLRSHFGVRISDMENGGGIVGAAIDQTLYAYNREFYNKFMGLFVERTIRASQQYRMPTGGTLQPLDPQHGIPRPRSQYSGYKIGTPIEAGGDAMGDNRVTRALVTVGEANTLTQEMQDADVNWNTDHMMAAMLVKEPFQYEDETKLGYVGAGLIDVVSLANGDNTPYIRRRGRSVGTDNHYTVVVGAISTTNDPFPAIKKNLTEHGTNVDARTVCYVADNLAAVIQGMAHFVPVTRVDINPGANTTTVSNAPDVGIGDDVLGSVSGVWIVQSSVMPDGYMLTHLEGSKPLSMREYPTPALQGFFRETDNVNGNHMQVSYIRICGYGGRNRVAAVATQVGVAAGAVYTSPAEYAALRPAA